MMNADTRTLTTTCCIAGGGPAGMMLGLLLARTGVDVIVLEKHKDFLRDFRGDTVHPSTLQVMDDLGLLEDFLKRPHQEMHSINGQVGDKIVQIADFSHLPVKAKFIALMPQWDFLDFLAGAAKKYPEFHLMRETKATGLIAENGKVTGLTTETPQGSVTIKADLVIGADGRHSIIREKAGLKVRDIGAPIDVLWFRVPKGTKTSGETLGTFKNGKVLVTLDRGDYWQCAYVIYKNGFDEIRVRGLEQFRADVSAIAPKLEQQMNAIQSWDDVKLLTVAIDRLEQWWAPGLLCIGDAAHAMSPIGGVGINLAIQDAVAAANILALPLLTQTLDDRELRAVQLQRQFPMAVIQRLQVFLQDAMIVPSLQVRDNAGLPWPMRLLNAFPVLRRIPARIVGLGIRPERVRI
jgi:2-polyprenyl-6-methoxyphenol hydroxylase-like FAD-dependent oxidoreductase